MGSPGGSGAVGFDEGDGRRIDPAGHLCHRGDHLRVTVDAGCGESTLAPPSLFSAAPLMTA